MNISACLGTLNVNSESSVNLNIRIPSKSSRNFCRPKFVYLEYVALKKVFLGLPLSILFIFPSDTKFNSPPGILYISNIFIIK